MELQHTHRTAGMSGMGLNIEELSGLEVVMLQRKLEENLPGKMYFWGKIFGTTQDYLIVHTIDPYAVFPEKKYYFCTTSDYVLKALPTISSEYGERAEKLTSTFTGDPSFFAFNGDEEESPADEENPDAAPVERFREIHRLSNNVQKIDHDCSLVPRGALVVDAAKRVIPSAHYQGLSYQTATEKRAYMHYRKPESLQGIALMRKPGIVMSGDYLDGIDKDAPAGMWTISNNAAGTISVVKNLYWEGFTFYTVLGTSEHGNVYFGTGIPNYDIAFML